MHPLALVLALGLYPSRWRRAIGAEKVGRWERKKEAKESRRRLQARQGSIDKHAAPGPANLPLKDCIRLECLNPRHKVELISHLHPGRLPASLRGTRSGLSWCASTAASTASVSVRRSGFGV